MPTPAPSPFPSEDPDPPTDAPTEPPHHHKEHHASGWKILGKTLAWIIIIALSVLLFGAVMSNRYRIYYYLRSCWYRFLRWERTQWLLRKLRLDRLFGQQDSLNEIIFDHGGDLHEGLLMQDT
jgi:hypothetical protein